ncbi:uncharacterized protein LOC131066876 [Cryptomeria japonica]|uniref:uncharacterized protein LOC131066876 n=1 Tax=Cryptomeria japonica TaxID=3369 RepID=UPI0025ACF9FA|nr:uncharacterized protein LOC131066876 [Cryptomeria japonica]
MVKPKKRKPENPSPKPRKTRKSTHSSSAQKPVPPPKPQDRPSSGAEKRKKGKLGRVYVAATVEEEIESDEEVREVKKSAIVARVVKKQPSREGHPSKKPRVEPEQTNTTLKKVKEAIIEQDDIDDSQEIADSGEASYNPLVMNIESKKKDEEVGNEKGDDIEKEEKDKDEGKDGQAPVARDTCGI